jgi:hypothetical protein
VIGGVAVAALLARGDEVQARRRNYR